jgi:hypothetical protein
MRWTFGRECARREESPAQAEKCLPVADGERQIRVLGGPMHRDAVRMNEEDVASGGTHQQKGRIVRCPANC